MAGYCITDDDAVCEAAKKEIVRRYYSTLCKKTNGSAKDSEVYKMELLMNKVGVGTADRPVVKAALDKAHDTNGPAVAIELPDGRIVTGKTSLLLGASASALLNALKALGGINDELHLIPPAVIEPVSHLKTEKLGGHNPRLHADEVLVALAISATTNSAAELAMKQLDKLRFCEAHSSVMVTAVDSGIYRKLGLNLTQEPVYQSKKLFHRQ